MKKNLLLVPIMFLTILNFLTKPITIYSEDKNDTKPPIVILVEEFPTEENLAKLELFDFPINIFVAAKNIAEFKKIEDKLKKYPVVKTVGYWPTLKIEEVYWFSPFSKREGIERTIKELENIDRPISILWDAELPHLRRRLFLTEILRFFSNREIIRNFVAKSPKNVTLYVAENRNRGTIYNLFLKMFGVTFVPDLKYNRIEMLYGKLRPETLRELLDEGVAASKNYYPAFGTTAEGVGEKPKEKNWMRISPKILDEQLNIAQKFGIKGVVIYRLGGIDKEYLEVIKKSLKV